MRANAAKQKLKTGEAIIGPILGFTSPQVVEIAGRVGLHSVFIDCEHGAIGMDDSLARTASATVSTVSTLAASSAQPSAGRARPSARSPLP